jgi:predicted secreted protein
MNPSTRSMMLLALAGALAGCTPKMNDGNASQQSGTGNSVPAPIPASVAVRITQADAGQTRIVPVGTPFSVQLVGVPTAGYRWQVVESPEFLSEPTSTSGNTTTEQAQPGFTGGQHWEVFTFTATRVGRGNLRLEQRRPWEPATEPAAQSFDVTIEVR